MYAYNSGDDLLSSSDGVKKRRTSASGEELDEWADDLDSEFFEVCVAFFFLILSFIIFVQLCISLCVLCECAGVYTKSLVSARCP